MLSELGLAMGGLIRGLRPGCVSGQDTGAREREGAKTVLIKVPFLPWVTPAFGTDGRTSQGRAYLHL